MVQFVDIVLSQVQTLTANFKHPVFLWGIPILFVILLFLITRNLVRYSMDDDARRRMRRQRIVVFLLRFLSMGLLCVALATPFTELTKESDGNPHAVILVDKSGSMDSFDESFIPQLEQAIGAQLPVTVKEFGTDTDSPVGDALLGQRDHILLISDGNANSGVDLMDVAQVARENNLSINTIKLMPLKDDTAVFIDAPANVPIGYPLEINIDVTSTGERQVPLTVLIDGKQVASQQALGRVTLKPNLAAGYHTIEARIPAGDTNAANDAFYRVVQVLEKPKVLVVAREQGTLEQAMAAMFDTTVVSTLPPANQLSQYSAIVIDDTPAGRVGDVNALAEFLRDEAGGKYGGGLVVVGGFNSFDRGGYGNTKLEGLLPIKVGKAKKSIGENNIVFVIQMSGTTTGTQFVQGEGGGVQQVEREPVLDIIKAQAVSAINSLNLKNNVGVIAYGRRTGVDDCPRNDQSCFSQASVVKLSEIRPLHQNKKELTENIPRVVGGGRGEPDVALKAAVDMLKDKSGDKTIILLTNGLYSAGKGDVNVPTKVNTLAVIENARKRYNIKTQIIGVGASSEERFTLETDEAFLKLAAQTGDSTYDRATNLRSLIIKYGDPKEKGFGEAFTLVPLSLTHFITKDVDLTAQLNGFNEVVPKEGARLLVTTDAGDPALTVWNYFNGRVAAITVFSSKGLGQLLEGNNSDLVRNTILWAVGDPSRKQEVRTNIRPAVVGQETEVTFVSKQPITGSCPDTPLTFERSSGDTYVFTFTPQKAGFGYACGVPYAVNGESEAWKVGPNTDLRTAVGITGGDEFTFDQVDAIVEQIRTVSTRVTVEKTEIRNPVIFLALAIFLLEIFIRRFMQYRKS